jgi:YndJ-like protein
MDSSRLPPTSYALGCAAAGGAAWLAWFAWQRPPPGDSRWVVALLLLAPLALFPLGLRLMVPPEPGSMAARCFRTALVLQLPAALALAASFLLPSGIAAVCLALPWLAVTLALGGLALSRFLERGPGPVAELAIDAGLALPIAGTGWALFDRAGFRPLAFAPLIVLLTAVHFHYAGFALPLLTGLAGRTLGGAMARLAALGVIAGVPLVAAGITASQLGAGPLLEAVAAGVTALAGVLAAGLHLRLALQPAHPLAARLLWGIAGLSLAGGMLLAGLYGARSYLPLGWLEVPRMWALHGTAGALGFALCGLAGWNLIARRQPSATARRIAACESRTKRRWSLRARG